MAALILRKVSYTYPGGRAPALDRVDLTVEPGELVLVVGESGCGKSTLLRAGLGLVPHFHGGQLGGRVLVNGLDTRDHPPHDLARQAGLVFQDPETQLVMRRVDREVAFGLENLGCPPHQIAVRAEEALMTTGASRLAERDTGAISGGEQQRVAIASVMAMGQRMLFLDEPTSQLDPVAAEELLGLVQRINHDRGVTVVLAEHRTGRLFAEADRVVVMDAGRITFAGSPQAAARHLAAAAPWLLPPVTQAFAAAGAAELPLSVREARALCGRLDVTPAIAAPAAEAIGLDDVHKMRGRVAALVGASTGFGRGRITALVGENGAGKTTLAVIACGLMQPDRGRVRATGRCAYVSQNPAHHLIRHTVADEVAFALENLGVAGEQRASRVAEELERFGLSELRDRHPHDLSSGERQRLAIASVTVMRPEALMLDEPTRGMDGLRKLALVELLRRLAADGAAVGLITHDIDFAAEAADLVTTMARGRVLADRAPRELLASDGFFASQVGTALGCVSIADAVPALRAREEAARV